MDLLSVLRTAQGIGEAAKIFTPAELQATWITDKESFFRHFGVSPEAYAHVLELLSPEQLDLYERTLAVNPEAAVLWVLAMDEIGP
ncbi:MAG TPA: hypothetical protein VMS77_09485 [Conexivisphaerales archaeon]|nr:hypothetical protein [Conexivisphaerales archaeon]